MNMERNWQRIIQGLAVLTAVSFWGVSVMFSKQGFGINLQTIAWLGYILACGVTVMELILNRGKHLTPTLFAIGILAYVYGIGTNVYGIVYAQATQLQDASVWNWIFGFVLGVIIEVVPEPLFLYGIGVDIGDLVSSLMQNPLVSKAKGGGRTYTQTDGQPWNHFGGQTDGHADGLADGHYEEPPAQVTMYPSSQSGQTTKAKVRAYVIRHMGANKSFPSVRTVATALGKDRSTVGEIMSELRKQIQ